MEYHQVDRFLNWLTRNGARLEYVSDGQTRGFLLGGQTLTVDELQEHAEEWLVEQGTSVTEGGAALVVTVAMSRVANGPRAWPVRQ